MIKFNGIIHLENEDIAVQSLKYLGKIVNNSTRTIASGSQIELTLQNNEDYNKLKDLDKFSVEFRDVTINNCILKPRDQTESIKELGFLEGDINSSEDIFKMS